MSTGKRISVFVLFLALVVPILAARRHHCSPHRRHRRRAAHGGHGGRADRDGGRADRDGGRADRDGGRADRRDQWRRADRDGERRRHDGSGGWRGASRPSRGNPAEQKVNTDSFARFNAILLPEVLN